MIKKKMGRGVCYFLLLVLAFMCIFPFYNIFINATHESASIATGYRVLPGKYLMENYRELMYHTNIWRAFANSLVIALASTALSSYFGALTAYGLAKFNFRFKKLFFWIILISMMIPSQLGMIGYFEMMNKLGLLDRYAGLIIPSIASASTAFFVRQYIVSSVSDALIECARIDGCNEIAIFHKIVFPIITPAVFTQAIFTFIGSWNNFLTPLILLFTPEKMTLPVLLQSLHGNYDSDLGIIYLGLAISVIPIVIFAAFFLKRITGGLTVGAVKE